MSKVLWGEGLFLRPQHFQRQDTYHEARLHHVAQSLHPYPWGIRQIRLDPRALESGAVRRSEERRVGKEWSPRRNAKRAMTYNDSAGDAAAYGNWAPSGGT